jgi:hypothetical protein
MLDSIWRDTMERLTYKSWGLLLTFLMISSECLADSWTCQHGALTRNVIIFYPNTTARLPCKVYYAKPKENVIPRTLWQAEFDEKYCKQKAVEFIEKLESWDWQCSADSDP